MENKFLKSMGIIMSVEKCYKDEWLRCWDVCLIIENINNTSIEIKLDGKSTYLTKSGEQIKQYGYDSNYYYDKFTIMPSAKVKAVKRFLIDSCENGDCLFVKVDLPNESFVSDLCFKLSDGEWVLVEENKYVDTTTSPESQANHLMKHFERLEAIEELVGISIDNLKFHVFLDDYFKNRLDVLFEIHSTNGPRILKSFDIYCVLYGIDGSIDCKSCQHIDESKFYAIKLCEMSFHSQCDIGFKNVSKIRIYPQI